MRAGRRSGVQRYETRASKNVWKPHRPAGFRPCRCSRSISIDAAAESFGRVCDRAGKHDWRIHLEFVPISGIPDLEPARAIVKQADRSNGGILFDSWHYFCGRPDHDLLRSIPGDGDLDLPTVIGSLDDTGGLDSVGVDLFSDRFDELDPKTAGKRSGESLQTVLGNVEGSDNR